MKQKPIKLQKLKMLIKQVITFSLAMIALLAIAFVEQAAMDQDFRIIAIILLTGVNIIHHASIVYGKVNPVLKTTFLYGLLLNITLFVPILVYEIANYIGLYEMELILAVLVWITYIIFFIALYFNAFPPKIPEIDEIPFYQLTDVLIQPKNKFARIDADQEFMPLNTSGQSVGVKIMIGILVLMLLAVIGF